NHLMAFLAAPALFLFILLVHPKSLANWKLYVGGVVAVVLGLSVHLFLPIRAELDPVINQNDPTCESLGRAATSVLTMGGAGCEELSAALQREQYHKPKVVHDPVAGYYFEVRPRTPDMFVAQLGNYLQYFDWQWARGVAGNQSWFGGFRPLFTLLFVALGIFGAAAHYRRDRVSWAYVLALFFTLSAGLVFYLNFRYGYTYPFAPDPRTLGFPEVREVRERDYFFIVGFSVWALWAGIGLAAAWRSAALWLARRRIAWRRAQLLAAPVLAIALLPLALNWSWATRADDYAARDWAYNLLMSVEPYGVLFTNGDNDTFPLWYLQEVEGIRRDVTVVVGSYLRTPWYAKQIRDLTRPCNAMDASARHGLISCQRRFAAVPGTPYDEPAQPPEDSVLPLTDRQIDQVASGYYVVREPATLRAAGLETTIPSGTVLEPADTFITAIVQASLGERPIHFVAPSPALQKLNLTPFTVRTGLTLRLAESPVIADGPIVRLPPADAFVTGSHIDLERTRTLLEDVFIYRGLPENGRPWVDSATMNILLNYVSTHIAAARGRAVLGEDAAVQHHLARADAWGALVR
ncbi:MAG: hypothetical protein ACRELX_18555, partial [Longimicrobiales bacterium]